MEKTTRFGSVQAAVLKAKSTDQHRSVMLERLGTTTYKLGVWMSSMIMNDSILVEGCILVTLFLLYLQLFLLHRGL